MTHYQHIGPFGEYRIPAVRRFRRDKQNFKTVSLDPEVEIVETGGGGREESHHHAVLRFGNDLYAIYAVWDGEYDVEGRQIAKFGEDGRKIVGSFVFSEVLVKHAPARHGTIPPSAFHSAFRPVTLANGDPLFELVMDYLSLDRGSFFPMKIVRIVFHKDQQITPKNYRVIGSG